MPTDIWTETDSSTIGAMDPNTGYGLGAQILRPRCTEDELALQQRLTFKGIGNYGLEILDRVTLPLR